MKNQAKYDSLAVNFSESQYKDFEQYYYYRYKCCNRYGPKIKNNQTVLELGCGDGEFTKLLLKNGASVLATDFSHAMLKQTVHNLSALKDERFNAQYLDVNNIHTYPSLNNDYTIALMRTFLYYCDKPNHIKILKHLHNITNKKIIFDYNPRVYKEEYIVSLVQSSGFSEVYIQGFFHPQTKKFSNLFHSIFEFLSKVKPLRFFIGRFKFNFIVTAVK